MADGLAHQGQGKIRQPGWDGIAAGHHCHVVDMVDQVALDDFGPVDEGEVAACDPAEQQDGIGSGGEFLDLERPPIPDRALVAASLAGQGELAPSGSVGRAGHLSG